MRINVLKKHSTKAERIFYEVLKLYRIPFKHRWLINNREVDFLLFDKYCIEIDGHYQSTDKNEILAGLGYIPIHLNNSEVTKESVEKLINKITK